MARGIENFNALGLGAAPAAGPITISTAREDKHGTASRTSSDFVKEQGVRLAAAI